MCRIFFLFVIGFAFKLTAAPIACHIESGGAIIINAHTGKVLFAKNAHKPFYPASMTKIATGYYAFKYFPHLMNKRVRCSSQSLGCLTEAQKSRDNYSRHPSYVLEKDMSHMGLKVGEEMTFRDLLLGTMVVSADDASNVVAEVAGGGSIEQFMSGLNNFIQQLGLKNTRFLNPHGLHHPEHLSTPYDMAELLRVTTKDPQFFDIIKRTRFDRPRTNKQEPVTLHQTNKLIVKSSGHYYPYALGGKTGYHRRARHNLACVAEKNNRRLIAVVMYAEKRDMLFRETKKLFEAAFSEELVQKSVVNSGLQSFVCTVTGGKNATPTFTTEALRVSYYPSEEPEIRCQLYWDERQAPVKKGDRVGELHLLADNNVVQKVSLFAASDVEQSFAYSFQKTSLRLIKSPLFLTGIIGLIVLGIAFFYFTKRRA